MLLPTGELQLEEPLLQVDVAPLQGEYRRGLRLRLSDQDKRRSVVEGESLQHLPDLIGRGCLRALGQEIGPVRGVLRAGEELPLNL